MCSSPRFFMRSANDSKKIIFHKGSKPVTPQHLFLQGYKYMPCGQCSTCRLKKSREDAVRSMHEQSLYSASCWLTLTYDSSFLPPGKTLFHAHVSAFMKKLRAKFSGFDYVTHKDKTWKPIRMMMCGEYGDKNARPHYHLCLYNFDFDDKEPFFMSGSNQIYRSRALEKLWTLGNSSLASLSFESAAYTARYCMKKRLGCDKDEYYGDRYPDYGRYPSSFGLGRKWIEKNYLDVYRSDKVVFQRGSKFYEIKPPRYYDKYLEKVYPQLYSRVVERRNENSGEFYKKFDWKELDKSVRKEQIFFKQQVRKLESL